VHDAQGGVYGAAAQRLLVISSLCDRRQFHQLAQSAAGRRHELGKSWRRLHQLAHQRNDGVLAAVISCASTGFHHALHVP